MSTYNAVFDNPFKAVWGILADRLRVFRADRAHGMSAWRAGLHMLKTGFNVTKVLVPIRSLNAWHKKRILAHLLGLDSDARYLRFGYAASDEQVAKYVNSINFRKDDVFGIYNRKLELIAVAHLARSEDLEHRSCAEFGVSVSASARGRGYGTQLFDRAVMHARNHGVQMLFIHALSENTAMLKIARNAGARVEREGSESNAYLMLPGPNVEGMVHELLDDNLAHADYWLKLQARSFRKWLDEVHTHRFK